MVDIYPITGGSRWEFVINREQMFSHTSLASVRITDKLAPELRTDNREMTEEDSGLFNSYFSLAISDLIILLARYFSREFTDNDIEGEDVYITMSMDTSAKDSVAYALEQYIKKYVELRCLQEWFGAESSAFGVDASLDKCIENIRHIRNYRKTTASLPIDPLL